MADADESVWSGKGGNAIGRGGDADNGGKRKWMVDTRDRDAM
ncbi:hypothetical protein [Burkholderia lata]|nr:hypothetical protein [Burkholderia lata]